jgi:exopolyphosphatase/guanosine-5'-triphosphate,3'-diphosphate pyrophosphatase
LRLLIADVDAARASVDDIVRDMEIVRLGQGVDKTRRFASGALERTFATCRKYAEQLSAHDVERTRFVATSASRDATNRDEFFEGVRTILGVDVEIVSGDEEARLSFAGATQELLVAAEVPAPYLVVDIGGGSTEFVLGEREVEAARSVDVGCVRLAERHFASDPATAAQIDAARADVVAAIALAEQFVPVAKAQTLVGLAGSVTTIAALALELPEYDAARIHHSQISAAQVHDVSMRLLSMTRDERAALAVMHPGRADVIGAGALVLDTIMARLAIDDVVVSEHDILDGIALGIAEEIESSHR